MSEEECRQCGVPELQVDRMTPSWDGRFESWPTCVYTALHDWQVSGGFDPTTADWAHSSGYPEFEIIGGKKEEARFEGVKDYVSYLNKLREQEAELQLETSAQVQENTPRASHSNEQGSPIPPPAQNEPLSVQG
ncbi:hypothetical protein VNI00_015715 [Paramarasmius palmivorus]|uniref:Uncharacterized protein n=1 Tax=Paramarasmius palmivorus TaxID=297713 RepID=A0AAW0BJC9_9AGAR